MRVVPVTVKQPYFLNDRSKGLPQDFCHGVYQRLGDFCCSAGLCGCRSCHFLLKQCVY